ncbi:MAG TPA: XrtA system polysaccharide chain length determinant [Gammaproteobacteria bacterium]|nr:XrtA system polysaccharide chain length determinant [Gammaproteobacteria bacterium]
MRELIEKIWQQVRGTWRFRWIAFVMVWVIALGGWTLVYFMPNVYEAQTEVYVDTDSILRPLLAGLTVHNNLQDHVRMMRLALLSRPNLEEVARKTDLTLQAQGPDQTSGIVQRLRNSISVSNRRNGNLYTISYKNSDRHRAKAVVQALLNIFMEHSLSSNQSDNASARQFLKSQLDSYKKKLDDAEQKLANFKKQHVGEMPNQGQDYFDRLQSAQSKVQDTKTQLKVAEQRRDELEQSAQGEQPTFAFTPPAPLQSSPQQSGGESGPGPLTPLQKQIKSLQMKLNNMLLQYTNQYPGVIELKKQIAMLKKQEKSELNPRRHAHHQSAPVASLNADNSAQTNQPQLNPVYQDTLMSLNQAKADVAALKAQLQQQQQQVKQLRSKINVIPEVEAKLSSLTRNYSVMQDRYHKILQRYEEAQLANTANTTSDQVKFRVINPPFVDPKPVGPKRGRYLFVVLFFALAAGGGFAFFLHQIRPVFLDAQQLRQVTGLPVLGSVSRVWANKSRAGMAMSLMTFAGGLAVLLVAFVAALIFKDAGSHVLREAVKSFI